MSSNLSDFWSPPEETTTFADTHSQTRHSYTDSQRLSSDGEDPEGHMRRLNVSPSPSQQYDDRDDGYTEGDSIDEIDAVLNTLDDDEVEDSQQSRSQWSPGSYSSAGPTFSSATGTFTYSGTYTGSPSYVSLPTFSPRSPVNYPVDPRSRLSRITERTEESRPTSTAFSGISRPVAATPDNLRRSAFLAGPTSFHSRSSTEPTSDRTLPIPGRLGELIAVFESQSPSTAVSHSRSASTPGQRSSSPMFGISQSASTGYGYGSTTGYGSRPSSPSKSGSAFSGTHISPDFHSSLLSPPVRPTTTSGLRSVTPATESETQGYTTASFTMTPSAFSNTVTQTGSYTTPNTDLKTITGSEDTFTRRTVAPTAILRIPQSPPRSPRNIVALWKERTPASARTEKSSVSPPSPSRPVPADEGLYGVRRRFEGARARMRESRGAGPSTTTPVRPTSQEVGDRERDSSSNKSGRSGRSSVFPPGFDLSEFSTYARSTDPPSHMGSLWYLNVHASPPYRWQRCQALLYPHVLLLSWLASGGGRGIVALDLLNCTSIQSAPSPTHPIARDDVGTIAARQQSSDPNGLPLMEMLVPFHMMYADGVERLAAESILERQKWVNRIWEAVNRPIAVPDSVSVTRSPTGSIQTILTIESDASHTSNGSRSTVFVPPLSSIPDISDFQSSPGLSRQSSIVSSHHSRTVDDTVIQNQEYVYPGDERVITPSRDSSLRRSGSLTALDDEFKNAIRRARGTGLFGSPVTITSGSSLGKDIFVTSPPTGGRVSDDDRFFSAGSEELMSNVSSTYFSPTATPMTMSGTSMSMTGTPMTMTGLTPATSVTHVPPSSTFTRTHLRSESGSELSFAESPSTLSRVRVIRRRVASTARSLSSGYQSEVSRSSSDKENEESIGGSRTPMGSYDSYTPGSGSLSLSGSGSYLDSRSRTPTGSYTGSFSGSERSGSGSYSGSRSYTGSSPTPSGGYTPGSGSFTLQPGTSSGIGDHTPISSSETGYDICPSSDLTDFTRMLTSATVTPVPLSPVSVAISEIPSAIPSEKYVTASQASTEYDTVAVISSRASVTSFESLPTIPSDYWTAASVSSYRTASEPSERSPPSLYATPTDLPEIPSQVSTPVLAMPTLPPDIERPPAYVRPILPIPVEQPVVPRPTIVPTRRRSPSVISDLSPDEVPLPPSAPPPAARPLPRTPSPVLSPELPLPTRPTSSPSPSPSPPSITESAQVTPRVRPISAVPSLSPSLSATPTPLSPSTVTRDVITPTSYLPPPSTESLSLLSTLPPSTVQSTSVITPTSVAIVSASTASTLPPPTPLLLPSSAPSLSITTSISPTTLTQTSSSFIPPSPQPWASATDVSYESSILHPSPSIRSVALGEGGEFSFETSILRPTGSPSSVGRMSTIPASPTQAATVTPYSPLPPLTPVPALPSSVSSPTDIGTPTSLEFTSESSSLSRSASVTSSSYLSESSLTPSEIEEVEIGEEEEEEVVEARSIRTISTLLSTVPPLIRPSPSSTPSVLAVPSLPTPEGTVIMSITTPQGSGATEHSSLRTMPSVSAVTERDLGRDVDRLADEIRTYDQARGLEHQDLVDNVRALRDEIQGLADYFHRTPSPATPGPHRAPPSAPRRIELVDRPIGDSSIISSVYPHVIEVEVPGSGLTRSTSNASSVESYLSSHYSDEDILDAEPESTLRSPAVWEEEPSTVSSLRITSSSSISSSPLTRSSELESEATTAMPQAPDIERALRDIGDKLRALEDGQNAARDLLEGLQTRPEDHTGELAERLQRIENLIQILMDQGHPRGPEIPQVILPSRTASISDSTDSLRRLRSILSDLVSPPDIETRHMPLPTTARAGPSVAQQLDDILSSTQLPQPTPSQLPHVEPFAYRPTDRGRGARSASPTSMELPPRSQTVPLFYPISQARPSGRPIAGRRPRGEPSESESITPPPRPRQRPEAETEQVFGDLGRRGEPRREDFHVGPGPTPRPVFGDLPRATTAPADIGSSERVPDSWYRQPQQPKLSTGVAPGPPPGEPPAGVRYMPMPAGPTVVQMPPLFDSLLEILRENRLAQLATVDQQRELMRYMRGLNEWLERDVHNRQNEIRGIHTRVDQLSRFIHGMRGRRPTAPSSPSTEESETAIRYNFPTAPPQFPGIPPGFQPFPVDRPVFPPVIPEVRTSPVIPPPQPTIIVQPAGGVIPGQIPPIPRLDYHPAGPGPQPSPRIPDEQPPFIPPSRASTGTPRRSTLPIPHPHPSMGAGQTIVHRPYSPSSSRDSSTESTRRSGRRRSPERGRRYGSRRSSSSRTPSSRSRRSHLAVINGPGVPPPIHIISPSVPGTAPPGQPMVVMQPPTQPVYQPPLTPGGFGFPPTVSEMGGPVPVTPIGGPMPTHIPVTDIGYPPMSVGAPGMPMSVTPGMQGIPMSTAFPPVVAGPPMVIQRESPESSRSRSSRRRRRDETQPQTLVIERRPRSPTMPPIAPVASVVPGMLPGVIPGVGTGIMPGVMQPPMVMMGPESPRSERRRRSRSPERIAMQPQLPMMPTVLPSAAQGPIVVPTPGAPMYPGGPPLVVHPESRSHSRSPRRLPAPVILQPQQPLLSDRRYRSPRRSYSSERHRRHRSPRYSSYSPERRRHRSPSYYDRDDRRRDYDRYRRRSHSYHSRSPPPRRGRRSPASRSRTPPIHPLPPTVITGPPPTHYPRTHPPPTHYTPPHRSPHIQVIDIPTSPRRGRLPRRDRSFSPESPGFSASPRRYPVRRPATRPRDDLRPPRDRRSISSPPYAYSDRSRSPLPPRFRPPLRRDEREASPHERFSPPLRRDEREASPHERIRPPLRRDEREASPHERIRPPLRRDEREASPHERIGPPLRRDEREASAYEPIHSPSPLSTPERAAERMPRGPIKVTVPTATGRPPRVLAEAGPGIPVTHGPSIEPREGEVPPPSRLPVELEEREEAVQPTITQPIPPERRTATLPTRPSVATELGYPAIEDPREQIDALNRAADRLQRTVVAAEDAEDRREGEYRQREEDRMQMFLDNEAQRNEEARQRNEAFLRELELRLLAALPPVPAAAPVPEKPTDEAAEIESIKSAAERAASEHASDDMEMIRLEREEFAREREELARERAQLLDQLRAEKDHVIEEKDRRINGLEEEMSRLRADFENGRQQQFAEEADLREQERQERIAHDNEMRTQLADLTNLVQDSHNMIVEKKDVGDARYAEKQARRQDKEAQNIELRDMNQKILDDMEADRARCEDDKRDNREALERIIEELQRQNVELRELFQSLSDSWRADCQRHHEETLEAVRSTADKQVPFNVQGYLDEFSQALATEVRMLLGEVGKIREERRALQHEIAGLLSLKSKYGPGGEYEPDWRPPGPPPPEGMGGPGPGGPGGPGGPPPPGGPDVPPPGGIPLVKPAWRTLPKTKKKKKDAGPSTSAPPAPMPPQRMVPRFGHPVRQQLTGSWDTWQPDRNMVTPPSAEPTLMVPGRQSPGLFGPRTPSSQLSYDNRR